MLAAVLTHTVGNGTGGGWDVAARWNFDPTVIFVVALPGVLYALGLKKWTARPRLLKSWQPYAFYAGLAIIALALTSPIDALGDDLFTFHMLQHLMIMMVAPPLVLLGAPTTPVLLGLPRQFRRDVIRPLVRSRGVRAGYRVITAPFVAWGLFVATVWSWHFVSGAYQSALDHPGVHALEHVTFAAAALNLWLVTVDPRPMRSRLSYPFRMLFIVVTELQNIALGAAITFQDHVLYSGYAARPRLWKLSVLEDQQGGGAMMWVAGGMMLLTALVVVGAVWYDKSEKQAREREAAQDAEVRLRAGSGRKPVFGR